MLPVQLTTSRFGNLTRLIHTLLYVMAVHIRISSAVSPPTLPVSHDSHSLCLLYTNNSGCGKREEVHIHWSMVRPAKAAPVNGTKLP